MGRCRNEDEGDCYSNEVFYEKFYSSEFHKIHCKTPVAESHFKETLTQVFSCEFSKFFKTPSFAKHLGTTASVYSLSELFLLGYYLVLFSSDISSHFFITCCLLLKENFSSFFWLITFSWSAWKIHEEDKRLNLQNC